MSFPERKKKFGDQFLLDQNVPPPSFEEKKKAREQMFDHFEESTIEETRLVRYYCVTIFKEGFSSRACFLRS